MGQLHPVCEQTSGYLGQQRLHLIGFQFIGVAFVGKADALAQKRLPRLGRLPIRTGVPSGSNPVFRAENFRTFTLHYLRLNSTIIERPLPRAAARATKQSSETGFARLPPNFVSSVHLQ